MTLAFTLITSPAQAETFTDIQPDHWAYKEMTSLVNFKILKGYPDGTFRDETGVTRAQAAKIIALSLEAKPSTQYKPKFKDVPSSHWAFEYISPLTERGIFNNNDKFLIRMNR